MIETDLSREALLRRSKGNCVNSFIYAKNAIENWQQYGGFERVRDLLLEKLFDPWHFNIAFSERAFVIDSTVDRYHLIDFLISQGVLNIKNLKGKIVDIGCHLGATVDALALFGGEITGTDCGNFACESPSGLRIGSQEGRYCVRTFRNQKDKLSLVSCFNVDWVENMPHEGFAFALYQDALEALRRNGQILYTFSEKDISRYRGLSLLPDSCMVELPDGLNKREKYAFTAKKPKGN